MRRVQADIGSIRGVTNKINEQKARLQPLEDEVKKQMAAFDYRNVVPTFIGTLAKCLPSKEHNPDQATLYDAFEAGDVEGVLAVPRGDRQQLFVTRFAMEYSKDVETADFPSIDSSKG
ncbi:MAG: hypothetical protein ACYSOS_05865, partial [Planctomycetota bacterium]